MAIYIKKEVNGVEQEPKRVGVIPNGYPSNRISPSHVATASANQLYSTQLAELESAFDSLSDDMKLKAVIVIDAWGVVLRCENTKSKLFSLSHATASQSNIQCADLSNHTLFSNVTTVGNPCATTSTNYTSQTDTSSLTLMIV